MRPPLPPPQLSVTAESPHRGAAGTRRRQQHLIAHPGSKRIPPHLQPRRSLPPPGFIKPDLEESGPSAAKGPPLSLGVLLWRTGVEEGRK